MNFLPKLPKYIISKEGFDLEGFYSVYYTGIAGFGHAVLAIAGGVVAGADPQGSIYDGTYTTDDDGNFEISVTLKIPAGVTLVTGQPLPSDFSQKIVATLRTGFADGQPVLVQTPMGPVNAVFRKLRGMA